jgi:eukaryotic-like serine/threonine-protein kinase
MSSPSLLIDPYADTLEMPTAASSRAARQWERDRIAEFLGAQFQVVRELGRGGMGVVFLARDIALHRLVAIKVLRYEFTSSDEHRERFRREARLTARLSHPGIVPVFGFGEIGDLVYIVMKYVHGESLGDRMRRDGRVPSDEARRLLHDLALALDSAHRDGVIHRDLKAENILIERGTGRAMLTDFGVALERSLDPLRADASRVFGTPHYMSPEQAVGDLALDGRSDLYSLGVLGYYMLSGRLPFDAPTFEALAAKHLGETLVPLRDLVRGAPPALCDVIERALAKERDLRWRTGRDLANALASPARRRRWFDAAASRATALLRSRIAAELALLGAALRTVLRWALT